jgi:broad specificity phosphatase PhoE
MTEPSTTIHLLRHGEVENPEAILYGRLPAFHLSTLGRQMADRVAATVGDRDIVRLVSSPLERARETAQPVADALNLDIGIDPRVVEAANVFEGLQFGVGDGALRKPSTWRHIWNPIRPSWGEPYKDIVVRMLAAIHDVREAAVGHEALIVSHQLPIWMVRSFVEHRRLFHDPRRRQCSLASLTSLTYRGSEVVTVTYSEPAADLIPVKAARRPAAGA